MSHSSRSGHLSSLAHSRTSMSVNWSPILAPVLALDPLLVVLLPLVVPSKKRKSRKRKKAPLSLKTTIWASVSLTKKEIITFCLPHKAMLVGYWKFSNKLLLEKFRLIIQIASKLNSALLYDKQYSQYMYIFYPYVSGPFPFFRK